jgi:hypothetical protein
VCCALLFAQLPFFWESSPRVSNKLLLDIGMSTGISGGMTGSTTTVATRAMSMPGQTRGTGPGAAAVSRLSVAA